MMNRQRVSHFQHTFLPAPRGSGTLAILLLCGFFCCLSPTAAAEEPAGEVLKGDSDTPSTVTIAAQVCPTRDEGARLAYSEGYRLAEAGRATEAQARYHDAIELDPGFCDAYDNLGRLYRLEGDLATAIGLYRSSLSIEPNNPVALQNLGLALLLNNEVDAAIEAYEALIALAPDNPEGAYGLGMLLIQLDRSGEAIPHLETAERLYETRGSPLVSDARVLLALANADTDECAAALGYLDAVPSERIPAEIEDAVLRQCPRP